MTTVEDLLTLIDGYRDATGLSDSRVSTILFNDGKRVRLLRERNGDVGSRPLARAVQILSDAWPEDAAWPADVPRPAPQEAA